MNTDSSGMKSIEDTEEIEILHNIFGKILLYKINTPFLEGIQRPPTNTQKHYPLQFKMYIMERYKSIEILSNRNILER